MNNMIKFRSPDL